MDLTSLRTLGRSGLVVSPLALGTMTFGAARWGSPDDVSESIFNAYVDAGGNFVDTADVYAKGRSEELVGGYVAARGLRDRVVLATKYAWNGDPGHPLGANPLGGGNGRKNLHRELGLGITAWGPLAAGFLAGKYQRATKESAAPAATDAGRLSGPNPYGDLKFTDRNWRVLDALRAVAGEAGRPMAQVALAWAAAQPGITSLILGASRLDQLRDNLASLDVVLTPAQAAALDQASALDPTFPYAIFTDAINRGIFGGASVRGWR